MTMTSAAPIVADCFFIVGAILFILKILSWEEVRRHKQKISIQVCSICFILIVTTGFIYLNYFLHPTKSLTEPKIVIEVKPGPGSSGPVIYTNKEWPSVSFYNVNENSAPITDFRVEMLFRGTVLSAKLIPLVYTGDSLSGIHKSLYKLGKKGPELVYEDIVQESKDCSLMVRQEKSNGKVFNSNAVVFNCQRWPEKTEFVAEIVVGRHVKMTGPFKEPVGTYRGLYFYEMGGNKLSRQIYGIIPDTLNKQKK